jgi:acyl-CoA synthetase (NDP forming)
MAHGDVELIAGIKDDGAFGSIVVVGFGGVFVDVLDDTQVAAAPVPHVVNTRCPTCSRRRNSGWRARCR